jgi:hypothetical protein
MDKQTIQARYITKTDEQIAQLAQTAYHLTPLARSVLAEEIERRSLKCSMAIVPNNETTETQTTWSMLSDTTSEPAGRREYHDALKVFYITKSSMRQKAYFFWFLGILSLLLLLIAAKFLLFMLGIILISLGYFFWNGGSSIAQLVLYPDYLLFIQSSNNPKRYKDAYNMFIDHNFSRVNASEIAAIVRLNEFTNVSTIAIRIKDYPNPVPLLLIGNRREINEIYDLLKSTYEK